MGSRD